MGTILFFFPILQCAWCTTRCHQPGFIEAEKRNDADSGGIPHPLQIKDSPQVRSALKLSKTKEPDLSEQAQRLRSRHCSHCKPAPILPVMTSLACTTGSNVTISVDSLFISQIFLKIFSRHLFILVSTGVTLACCVIFEIDWLSEWLHFHFWVSCPIFLQVCACLCTRYVVRTKKKILLRVRTLLTS